MEDEKFVADAKIEFRVTGFKKKAIKKRAAELRKSVTKYLKDLVNIDLGNNKK